MNRQNHPKSLCKSYWKSSEDILHGPICSCSTLLFDSVESSTEMTYTMDMHGDISKLNMQKSPTDFFSLDNLLHLSGRCLSPQAAGRYDWDPFVEATPQLQAFEELRNEGKNVGTWWNWSGTVLHPTNQGKSESIGSQNTHLNLRKLRIVG